jgi:hypothetical protein
VIVTKRAGAGVVVVVVRAGAAGFAAELHAANIAVTATAAAHRMAIHRRTVRDLRTDRHTGDVVAGRPATPWVMP